MTVGVNLGFTLQLFKESPYQNTKPELMIYDIDPDKDIEAQLKANVEALDRTWEVMVDQAEKKIISQMPIVDTNAAAQIKLQLNVQKAEFDKLAEDMVELKKLLKPVAGRK